MILITSFPGSGNTFFHNILKEVYGITSGYFNEGDDVKLSDFISTHQLPASLPEKMQAYPSVCIVRDGREASISFSRSIHNGASAPLVKTIQDVTIARQGDYYDGWSIHVAQWLQKAKIVIRYEDLKEDPIREIERLRTMYPGLPKPAAQPISCAADPDAIDSHEDMTGDLEEMFWGLHGDVMQVLGYTKDRKLLSREAFVAVENFYDPQPAEVKHVLIEASTLLNKQMDGTKRYIETLLRALHVQVLKAPTSLDIKVRVDNIYPLANLFSKSKSGKNVKKGLVNGFVVYIVSFPRRLKNKLPNKSIEDILLVTRILGLLAIYQKLIQTFNRRLVSQYENNKLDLLHLTLPQRAIKQPIALKMTCTVHDLTCKLFPQFHLLHSIKTTDRSMKWIKKNGSHVIAVSNHTRADIIKHYDFANGSIDTIFEAIDHELFYPVLDPLLSDKVLNKYGIKGVQYFFSLCTLEPRKNLNNVLKAFVMFCERNPHANIKFVLAGGRGWKMSELPSHPNILATGYIPEEELAALYSASIGNCYVSFYEGFGLPPLEAMRCKTVAIYGNNSSMVELIGDAGLPADAHNVSEIAHQMEKIAFDKEFRSMMEDRAYKKSWEYTLNTLGKKTLDHYNSLV
ncbi:MAG: glycosyltransferase [Marinoscillum sp.]|uniref:glycosyltransferase n=3 Tax=Marinoscillum sp. TaxID=2024838 RepID=UPI00330383E0